MRAAPGPGSPLAGDAAAGGALGRRLFVLGRDGVAVPGAEETLLALDETGAVVVAVLIPTVAADTGPGLVDEFDRIAHLGPAQLSDRWDDEAELADAHAAFFELSGGARPALNHDQQAMVVAREPPDTGQWEGLLVELGDQLAGVYRVEEGELRRLEVPEELRRGAARWARPARTMAGLTALVAVGLAGFLLGRGSAPGSGPAAGPAGSTVREVTAEAPPAATHNQWIGQDHLVRTSEGRLLAVYVSDGGLQIAADRANQGRSWQSPGTVPGITGSSSSVALDAADRLHVAYSDGERVAYAVVRRTGAGWAASRPVELEATRGTSYVDVAYDEAAGIAHVVWARDGGEGQAPHWAAVSDSPEGPRALRTQRLAPPGADIPVLVNIAAGPEVVATYRRGDAPAGWSARTLAPRDRNRRPLTWEPEQAVPTEAGIGAADLAVDGSGTAHLVLRDSTSFELTYFTWQRRGGWSAGTTAVDAGSVEEIDFPSLTLDRSSRLVYVFFQSDSAQARTGVQVAVRDPARGWRPARPVAPAEAIPAGARHPSSIDTTGGAPAVLWTTGGQAPAIQAASLAP